MNRGTRTCAPGAHACTRASHLSSSCALGRSQPLGQQLLLLPTRIRIGGQVCSGGGAKEVALVVVRLPEVPRLKVLCADSPHARSGGPNPPSGSGQ